MNEINSELSSPNVEGVYETQVPFKEKGERKGERKKEKNKEKEEKERMEEEK